MRVVLQLSSDEGAQRGGQGCWWPKVEKQACSPSGHHLTCMPQGSIIQGLILITGAKEVINNCDDRGNMHMGLFLACCPFLNCTPTASLNHFSFIRSLLIGSCDPLMLPRFFSWPRAAVETLCGIVCMTTAIALCPNGENIFFSSGSMATTVWPWWFLGEWNQLNQRSRANQKN